MAMESEMLERIIKRLEMIEKRLARLEGSGPARRRSEGLTPALLRVLVAVRESGGISEPRAVAAKLGIPRNIASLYMNRLSEMGYLSKNVNPDPRVNARYVFELKEDAIDQKLEKLMREIKNE